MMKEIEKVIVHGGIFHADDVLVVAMIKAIWPDVEVERVFNVEGLDCNAKIGDSKVIVADIGPRTDEGGRYDHHQKLAKTREDGEKRAACGLVFEDLKKMLFPNKSSADKFEKDYIIPIEDCDNGIAVNPLSKLVGSYNPTWKGGDADARFNEAVEVMLNMLNNEIEYARAEEEARIDVETAFMKSNGIYVVLPEYMDWQKVLIPTTAKFVIFPSNRGGYNLQVVPVKIGEFTAKQDLPKGWLESLPEGCTFCHPGRFIAAFETKEAAISAVKKL